MGVGEQGPIPHMEYACVVWDPYTHKSVKALEQVQAFACKMVSH